MKTIGMLCVLLAAGALWAADTRYETGKIVSMQSVPCGSQTKGHKKTKALLCQEYILQTANTEYHVRQKQAKSAELLKIGQDAQFLIKKDQMRLRAALANGKTQERQYQVVSVGPLSASQPSTPPSQP